MNKEFNPNVPDIYPLTVVVDRYMGVYSEGIFLAFNMKPHEVPEALSGGDDEAAEFWLEEHDYPIGKGYSMTDAILDLAHKL